MVLRELSDSGLTQNKFSKLVSLFFQIYEKIPIDTIACCTNKNFKNIRVLYKPVLKAIRSLALCIILNVSDIKINCIL